MFILAALGWGGKVLFSTRKPAALPRTALTQLPRPALSSLASESPGVSPQSRAAAELPGNNSRFPLRLANTTNTVDELVRNDRAILLENALLDTAQPLGVRIPAPLRASADPGSYIVQARGPVDDAFRALLRSTGAAVVSYIPNNAYLVRASADAAIALGVQPAVQAVVPFEPYFKLKPALLELVLGTPGAQPTSLWQLNLVLFSDAPAAALDAVRGRGAEILAEDSSPFGRVLRVRAPLASVPALAGLPDVQELELAPVRVPASDLSRGTIGVASNPVAPTNYLGLTGANVLVNVNDTGVDAAQPDLSGRVSGDVPSSTADANGHGTHVAGIIAGSGSQSLTVTNAPGSVLPAANFQFRGQAPGASILSIAVNLDSGSPVSDAYLQQTAARTNAPISNSSWNYAGDNDYDLHAASYDAAVRDALPGVTGSQPLLCVFAAGNAGHGANDGTGGQPGSILSPATAKNVLTIGALEQARFVTNLTWTCATNGTVTCVSNAPWLALTDSSNQVASFSSRGNVGIGTEGSAGRFKPDLVAPGTFVVAARSTTWDEDAYYSASNTFLNASPDANYFPVLSNLNRSLGPCYRFESGTSLAAANVSGVLALMQEFFVQRLQLTNSPALMKALLINGARSLSGYDLHPGAVTNSQGWGLPHLPNSLRSNMANTNSTSSSMFFFDQNPAAALATGESQTRYVTVAPTATSLPLRVTLVWTDPPGNPVAAVKLVNDLDLIVTNLDTGQVFVGNDIPAGQSFNSPGSTANRDRVNNVENVFLAGTLSAHYSVTVMARRVNVNAVTAQVDKVAQDFALVIASGDGEIADALTLADGPFLATAAPLVTIVVNQFPAGSTDFGACFLHERVGANAPWPATNTVALPGGTGEVLTIGITNQWHFYVLTNYTWFTNAAFVTFLPPTLSMTPAAAASTGDPVDTLPSEADLDLYVSQDPGLLNLDPAVLAAADMSVGRGGSETILYSNATPGVFYIAVKSESQAAAEYGFFAVVSQEPFAQADPDGNHLLRGFPVPAMITGGTASQPGVTCVMCVDPDPMVVRRVIVTNTLTHLSPSDLQATLSHAGTSVVLSGHDAAGPAVDEAFIYDDSGQLDVPSAQPTAGPGSLRDFAGQQGQGQWLLTLLSTNQPGTNHSLWVFLEPQPNLLSGLPATLLPGACRQDTILVPLGISNLTVTASFATGDGPLSLQVIPADSAPSNNPSILIGTAAPGAVIIDATSHPPINPGLYRCQLCNLGKQTANVYLAAALVQDLSPTTPFLFASDAATPILDDAVTCSTIVVTNCDRVISAEVALRVDHPRVADLDIHLVAPDGTRVLLIGNRGADSAEGLGFDVKTTNSTPVFYAGGPQAVTNVFELGQHAGTVLIDYNFYSLPDTMDVYYESNLLFSSGLVSYSGSTNLSFGPGASTQVTVVMNQGGNVNSNTVWNYTLTSTRVDPVYVNFTENTNLAVIPIKFAPVPLTNFNYTSSTLPSTNAIFYLPEESLSKLAGHSASGPWALEIWDNRAGAVVPPPMLLSWHLSLLLQNSRSTPILLSPGVSVTNVLGSGQIQWFSVDVPGWVAAATNMLIQASAPVNLLFNQSAPPTGTNAGDLSLLLNATAGSPVLSLIGAPPLVPGLRYYLGVQNLNAASVTFAFVLYLDAASVVTLNNGTPFFGNNAGPFMASDFYRFVVDPGAVRAQFEIQAPTGDITLVARQGTPLPTLSSFDYISANPGTNDELLVVYDYSSPVSLSPGEWFLAAVNVSGAPVAYSITATEFLDYGTNIALAHFTAGGGNFCFDWNSLLNVHYCVLGKTSLSDPVWTPISPTITAISSVTSFCVPLASPYHFFRIREGLALGPVPILLSIARSNDAVDLRWSAAIDSRFVVEWSPSFAPPAWASFTNVITTTNGIFSFHDDGSQSGGLEISRYYRLRQL